jgi:hypothetical protein
MPRKDAVTGQTLFCVMCQNPIGEDRPRSSVTCSKECSTARKNFHRSREDKRACRYCQKPSTPEERIRYQRWRRWEKKHPELVEELNPAPQETHEGTRSNPQDA